MWVAIGGGCTMPLARYARAKSRSSDLGTRVGPANNDRLRRLGREDCLHHRACSCGVPETACNHGACVRCMVLSTLSLIIYPE